MIYDAVVMGAGMAGLTSAAYLCKSGRRILICERGAKAGGLVGSFELGGFTFPLSIERLTGNSEGAITGWAFTNKNMPAEHDFKNIAKLVNTPLPDIYQAGQRSFCPSGLPVSILTGKLAADAVVKGLKGKMDDSRGGGL